MIITGLYIVKNEENNIRRSIESIKNICDELIVIDTGSTDNTVELVESLGAKVYHFEWVNDFSKARNFALSKTKADLVIFIDADEWFPEPLTQDDREYLLDLVKQDCRVFEVLRSELDNNSLSEPGYNMRMLQGKKGLYYIGSIHECINDPTGTYYLPERFLLHHSGYDAGRPVEKAERNIALLYEQLKQETLPERRLMMLFYIARENWVLNNFEESHKFLNMYFELWRSTPEKNRPAHVGIFAYAFTAKNYIRLGEQAVPNGELERLCKSFVADFPKHPAAHYALANYYYTRHRDYDSAMKALEDVEACCKAYKIEDYPHDYVGTATPRSAALMIKGNILFDRGKRSEAFDCYTAILQKTVPSSGFLRRLLNLIKDQPTDIVISFLNTVPVDTTPEYIELLLSQIIYFPALKDVYLYYAILHLKLTKKHSDLSAIASLIDNRDFALMLHVSESVIESDPVTSGKLCFMAAVFADNPEIVKNAPALALVEGLVDSYFSGTAPESFSDDELTLIDEILPLILFVEDEETTRRFFAVLRGNGFLFANLILHYCNNSLDYSRYISLIDVDESRLSVLERAAFYTLMGRANTMIGDYADAMSYLSDAFELNPGSVIAYKELRILASVAPEYERVVFGLIDRFRGAMGQKPVETLG